MTIPILDRRTALAVEMMLRYAEQTGLSGRHAPRRYLWTDAFAVCNFLGLARVTGSARFAELAGVLVEQVHDVLGRHREDDTRTGWISGLDDPNGEQHPTIGGLRIGKPLPERAVDELPVQRLEGERDGQYFHYLTKWMLALERYGRATFDEQPLVWARELANTAYAHFTTGHAGSRRMIWKMSIDLSRPLVDSMGQHDPLDGLVTCLELDAAAPTRAPRLDEAIAGFTALIDRTSLVTADPLGLGGLLLDAQRLTSLRFVAQGLVPAILDAAATGLDFLADLHELDHPAERRLPFRELGLAIGLQAFATINRGSLSDAARKACARIDRHADLAGTIETFWMGHDHRTVATWTEHADINEVMLATALCPLGVVETAGEIVAQTG